MSIIGAHHTSYSVQNMTRSLAFYRDLLGFEMVHERPEVTNTYFRTIVGIQDCVVHAALLKIPGTDHHLEIFEYRHPRGVEQDLYPANPGSSHICYLVDDLNALYTRLKETGIDSFVTPPVYLDEGPNTGGWSLYLKDPDSIPIELFQAPSQDDSRSYEKKPTLLSGFVF